MAKNARSNRLQEMRNPDSSLIEAEGNSQPSRGIMLIIDMELEFDGDQQQLLTSGCCRAINAGAAAAAHDLGDVGCLANVKYPFCGSAQV